MDYGVEHWQRLMRLKKAYLLHKHNLQSDFKDVAQNFQFIEKSQYSYIYKNKGKLIFVRNGQAGECDGYIYCGDKSSQSKDIFHFSRLYEDFKTVTITYNKDGTLYSYKTTTWDYSNRREQYKEYFDTGTTIEDLLE